MLFFSTDTTISLPQQSIITIGTFDGVHGGHQQILQQLRDIAAQKRTTATVITFEPHPRWVLQKGDFKLLSPLAEKRTLLAAMQIDNLVVVPFNRAFSEQTPTAYIANFLVAKFAPQCIVIGYDHRFGHDRSGDMLLLERQSKRYGFEVVEIPKQLIDNIDVSSTKIRIALQEGNVRLANQLLGYTYSLEGKVLQGQQLGRTIGFPTANIGNIATEKLIPARGVYAARVQCANGEMYDGMMNIGNRPTVDGKNTTLEVHLFDFAGDLYQQTIKVQLVARLRDEQKFSDLAALQQQLKADIIAAKSALHHYI